jgi:hypothetical protein
MTRHPDPNVHLAVWQSVETVSIMSLLVMRTQLLAKYL